MANVRMPKGQMPQNRAGAQNKAQKNLQDKKASAKAAAAAQAAADDDPDVDPDGPDGALLRQLRGKKLKGQATLDELQKLMADSEAEADSGAATAMGIKRKGRSGGGMGQGDGFDEDSRRREAYEQMLLGNISEDKERFSAMTRMGSTDFFDPELDPHAVEALGLRAAGHMVRMYDHWMLDGMDRDQTIRSAAKLLSNFMRPQNVRRVLNELENAPIRDVYPLEVMFHMLENMPESLEGISSVPIVENAADLCGNNHVHAGHTFKIRVPKDVKIKAFALMGGDRPGYEFFPSPKDGVFSMQVDTPGTWEFALMGVPTKKVGRMYKEDTSAARVHRFTVEVREMGRKERPASQS
jgi:hypothetical protein